MVILEAEELVSPSEAPTAAQASQLVAACEAAWATIQRLQPGVPDAVIVLGSGVERGRLVKLGHWWSGRWIADGEVRGEVLLAGEALHLKPEEVFEVLLHEAAHGYNANRAIKDTSRGGRYHNSRFRRTAEQFGLAVTAMSPFGWASTSLTTPAKEQYRKEIDDIGDAMRLARRVAAPRVLGVEGATGGADITDPDGDGSRGGGTKVRAAQCGCGRRMRMAPSTLAAGPVLCGLCNEQFTTDAKHSTADRSDAAPDNAATTEILTGSTAANDATPPTPGPGAAKAEGLRLLVLAAGSPEAVGSLAAAGAWYHAWREGLEEPLLTPDVDAAAMCNELTRALLKIDGTLRGTAVDLVGRQWLVGDRVVVGRHDIEMFDADGELIPPQGVLGAVESIDVKGRSVVVDFPIHGTNRFTASSAAAAALDYGYAMVGADDGAPQIDLRLLDLSPAPTQAAPELTHVEL